MQSLLTARAAQSPHHTAFVEGEASYTYVQLASLTAQVVETWKVLGVEAGTPVGLVMNNSLDMVLCVHAALHMGAVMVLINTRLTPPEVSDQLERTDCLMVFYHDSTRALTSQINAPHTAYYVPYLYHVAALAEVLPETTRPLEAACAVVFTSGTSGTPKGALLTFGALIASAVASTERLGIQTNDRWLCVLPLYHVGGLSMIVRAVLDGTTLDLLTRFDVATLNQYLHEHPITLLSLVPTMLYRLLEAQQPDQRPHSLRLVLVGGAALNADLLDQAFAAGFPVATTYGMSETASQVATALPDLAQRKVGTVGQPLKGVSVRVVDADGRTVAPRQEGEILVRGATLMQGYLNVTTATVQAVRDGWLHTGDIGFLDEDGDLFVLQRRTDLIISGGENVYPSQIESVLCGHPAVRDALVVGLADAEWGQIVAALVTLKQSASEQEIISFCRERLARYKLPRRLLIVDELPQTASGKPQRNRAIEMLTQTHS